MVSKQVRLAVAACTLVLSLALSARAGDGCCDAPACCAPQYRTVCTTEWVSEQYQATKTCYRTEYKQETYTAYKCEMVPEMRTRTYTVCHQVPETHTAYRTVCVSVPCTEQRTVMQPHYSCRPVTHMVCKTEDHGHYECRLVPCKPGLHERLHKLCHKDCCEECPKMKEERCWVPCLVTVQCPVTRYERTCEYTPVTITVNTCKYESRQEAYQVTCYKSVPETKTETYQVCVSRQVPYQATRCVAVCVPYQETVTLCRLVPHTVEKQVPVTECCYTPCCETGHHHHHGHH